MKRFAGFALILLAILLVAWTLAKKPPRAEVSSIVRGPRSVLLVTVDTTRPDHLSPYGADIETPTMESLAQEGTLFDHAYAVAPITLVAHTAINTGLLPPQSGVRNNGIHYLKPEITTLAERLVRKGYRTAAFISGAVLNHRYGLNQGFEVYDDQLAPGHQKGRRMVPDRPAGATVKAAAQYLDELKDDEQFFVWVHFYDPHAAYNPPPPFRDSYRDRLYDGEIAYMDSQLGRLLGHRAIVARKDLAVIMVGDHGESLGEHGEQTHAILAYNSTLHVPLLMKIPGGPEGGRIQAPVSQIDLFPTILDLLGLEVEGDRRGLSLLPLLEGSPFPSRRPIYAETYLPFYTYGWAKLRVLIEGRWKFIDGPGPELYDLKRDPRELSNLDHKEPGMAHDLARDLRELEESVGNTEKEQQLALDSEAIANLRSLGYLGGGGSTAPEASRPNPRDVIGLHVDLENARRLLDSRLYRAAEERLKRLLDRDRNNVEGMAELVNALLGQSKLDDARTWAERALKLDPSDTMLHMELATVEQRAGNREKALNIVRRIREMDPHFVPAGLQEAGILRRLGRGAEAQAVLEKALRTWPDDPRVGVAYAQWVEIPQGAVKPAENRLRASLEEDPSLVNGYLVLGTMLERQNRLDEAGTLYREGLGVVPDDANLHAQLGLLLARTGGGPEAEAHLREALRLADGPRSDVRLALGSLLSDTGRFKEAMAQYDAILEGDPGNPAARNNQAIALFSSGRGAEALQILRDLVQQHPRYADAHNNLAAIANDLGHYPEAEREARRALKLSPSLSQAANNLGIALDEQHRYGEAERAFRHALEIDPGYRDATLNLAMALHHEGKAGEAVELLQGLLTSGSPRPEVHLELGDLYWSELDDHALARKHYRAFLKMAPRHPDAPRVRNLLGGA